MPDPRYHDAGLLRRLAVNLLSGWGYDFYNAENQLRADDQLIREKVSWLLARAHSQVDAVLADYRGVPEFSKSVTNLILISSVLILICILTLYQKSSHSRTPALVEDPPAL